MKPVQFYAYHGTSSIIAKEITKTNNWNPKRGRNDHWLGHGSYFFREDYEQALSWARSRYRSNYQSGKSFPAVLEVKINIEGDHFLNLDSREGLKFLQDHIDDLTRKRGILIEGQEELINTPTLSCLVFSAINKQLKWVILRTFPVHKSIYTDSPQLKKIGFEHAGELIQFGLQGPQVCVRNNEAIKEISIKPSHQENAFDKISVGSIRRERIPNDLFRKQRGN